MFISDDIFYVGVNDHEIDLFEGQYDVPAGMAYNSYVIMDEKIAVMDSVDKNFGEKWLTNIRKVIGTRTPDYLVVQHMEPDHSANIAVFEGDTLSLGKHELKFVAAPMVHWPEVMMTYDTLSKVFFSADAFGKFGALDIEEDWACEARRYYFGIVGKFGQQVQALLKKAAALDIKTICPLHGPVLTENLGYYLDLYNTWSSYGVETEGVLIAYTSVYGNTKQAAELLKNKLEEKGCPKVAITDLARDDMAEAVEDAFRYGKMVLATTTYNGDIFPFMREFINELLERNYQNRNVGIIENGTWAPMAAKVIRAKFEGSKDIRFAENTVTINAALDDAARSKIDQLAAELMA